MRPNVLNINFLLCAFSLIKLERSTFNTTIVLCFIALVSQGVTAETKIDLDNTSPFKYPVAAQYQELADLGDISATLGDYDISAMLTYDGEFIYINNLSAIPPGSYLTTIRVEDEDGKISILFNHRLAFYRERWQTSSELTATGGVTLNSKQNNEFIERVNRLSESALRLQAKQLGKNIHITTRIDIQHRSDSNTLSGEKLEIPDFYIGIEKPTDLGKLGLALGNQAIGSNGLVFNGFQRRGVSARLNDEQGRYSFKAFATSTDSSVSSKSDSIFSNHKDSRSSGVTVDFLPYEATGTRISLLGGYLDSRSQLTGTGIEINSDLLDVESDSLSYGGKTWFVATNAHWFEESLSLQLEQAQSRIDSDGFDFGEPAQEDKASRYRVALNSNGKFKQWLKLLDPTFWELSFQQQEVGADFYSMANIGLASNLQSRQSSIQLSWTEIQILLSSLEIKNNIDKIERLPLQTSRQNQMQINFSPDISLENSLWGTIGRPRFSVQLNETNRNQNLSDASLFGMDIDDTTIDSKFSASFQRKKLSWSLQHSRNKYVNDAISETLDGLLLAAPRSNTNNYFTSLTLSYNPSENWSFAPTFQKSKFKELETMNWQTSVNLGFQASMSFLTDTLVVYLNHNSSKQNNLFAEELLMQSYQNRQSSMSLNWLARKAESHNPGLKVSFNSVWSESKATLQETVDNHQLTLNFEVYWAAGVEQ
ncbi:MAG: hypothetical protein KUG78_11230 [Kangiellaceae bacterium]|nr:hypothetical protein [Kangiellaceae bacterium]